ncbi:MAG: hypothetical protein PHR26_00770 [Candidatus ainarchaeum sp.]|nr:hypothetical protein [Candidatus ainarchaeum sp.]MDD3976233.1 hypothetical protein [Candidatus ainarchaeum sp.]
MISVKAQIMLMDILIFLIICLLIISIETQYLKENIIIKEKEYKNLEELENILLIETMISDSNYLAIQKENIDCKNKIEIKNLDKLRKINNLKKIKISEKEIQINTIKCNYKTYTRAVIYNNKFEIIEVSFCEK